MLYWSVVHADSVYDSDIILYVVESTTIVYYYCCTVNVVTISDTHSVYYYLR